MTDSLRDERIKGFLDAKNKSEETHEKNLTYITAGALAVSLSLINTVIPLAKAKLVCILVGAWLFLLVSLIINLLSHRVTADFAFKKLNEFLKTKNDENKQIEVDMEKFNGKLAIWNWITVGLLIIGIVFLVTFCIKNI